MLPINDHSTPEEVTAITKMSKKVFKRSLGVLMKSGQAMETENGIKLIKR
jgi:predicted RNA-binding protein (virulence factor B family)